MYIHMYTAVVVVENHFIPYLMRHRIYIVVIYITLVAILE